MPMHREEMVVQALLKRLIISINEYDERYRKWKTFLTILALYTACVSPVVFGFLEEPQARIFNIIDNFVQVLFGFDIFLNFFVAYEDVSTLLVVNNPKKIMLHYLRTWFTLDVICNISPKFIGMLIYIPHLTYGILRLLQYSWHVGKVHAFLSRFEDDIRYNFVGFRCAKLVLVLLSYVHFGGCLFYFTATNYDPKSKWVEEAMNQSLWTRYVASSYRFRSTTFRTVHLRDLHANLVEMAFIILFKLMKMGLVGYVLGSVVRCIRDL